MSEEFEWSLRMQEPPAERYWYRTKWPNKRAHPMPKHRALGYIQKLDAGSEWAIYEWGDDARQELGTLPADTPLSEAKRIAEVILLSLKDSI